VAPQQSDAHFFGRGTEALDPRLPRPSTGMLWGTGFDLEPCRLRAVSFADRQLALHTEPSYAQACARDGRLPLFVARSFPTVSRKIFGVSSLGKCLRAASSFSML